MKKIKNYIALAGLLFGIASINQVSAQCSSTVKDGIKKLTPYTFNDQINSAKLAAGKPAEFHLSFYKGVNYKLQVCSDAGLGKVKFRVLDENKNEVYNNSTDNAESWSFFSNSSQELIVEVISEDAAKSGCAAVVVGMQVPKSSNSIRNL